MPSAEKGVGSRWNSIQQAVYDQDERRRLIAAVSCADRGEHAALALGSVNSILTTVDWVLRRALFVVPSLAGRQLVENCRRYVHRKKGQLDPNQLQHQRESGP